MPNEFLPLEFDKKSNDFNPWEMQSLTQGQIKISERERIEQEKERIIQEAIDKGYQEGLQMGLAEINAKKEELAQWLALVKKPVQLIDDAITQELIQTVIWLCEHCIGISLTTNPEKLQALILTLKEELPSIKENKTILMHPEDVAWIKKEIEDSLIPGLHEALVEDSCLKRGDFYIKSEKTQLDGCLHTRLSTLFGKYIDDGL